MRRKGYLPAVALILAVTMVPAGCGSKEEDSAPEPEITQAADTEEQPPVAVQQKVEITPLPAPAVVEGVDADNGVVILNVGAEHGATEDMIFIVYRDNGYVGQVQVEKVYPMKCSARINEKLTTRAVRPGDAAQVVNFDEDAPALDAVVEGVDMDDGIVIISVGAEHGVEKELKFFLYRGDEYVGRVEVDRILPTKSAARIIERMTATGIYPGDRARTRFEAGTQIAEKSPPPPLITSSVRDVDAAQEHVILNVGVKQDVKKGYPFFIYRGGEYIGKAQVVSVFPMLSMARIIEKMTLTSVKSGDKVTTRVMPDSTRATGPVPAIDATIAAADVDNGIVILTVEAEDSVKKGFTFFIHRGGDYIGQVRVVSVFESRCAAHIDEDMTRSAIKPGDGAKTRLGGF